MEWESPRGTIDLWLSTHKQACCQEARWWSDIYN